MGILTRLFSKKDVEVLEELERLFKGIVKKSQAEYIVIVGIKGNIKGLEILIEKNSATKYSDKELKRFNAILTEYYLRMANLPLFTNQEQQDLRNINYFFRDGLIFTIFPFTQNNRFIIISLNVITAKFEKNSEKIEELLSKIGSETA